MQKPRAERNRTLTLSESEYADYAKQLRSLKANATLSDIENQILHNDLFDVIDVLPEAFADLLIFLHKGRIWNPPQYEGQV